MKKDKALKLALDVLKDLPGFRADIDNAITELEEALAQPAHEIEILKLQIAAKERECNEIYGLLALAHLDLRHHLKYGFNEKTATSTLISVGQYYPKLKAEMEKNDTQ